MGIVGVSHFLEHNSSAFLPRSNCRLLIVTSKTAILLTSGLGELFQSADERDVEPWQLWRGDKGGMDLISFRSQYSSELDLGQRKLERNQNNLPIIGDNMSN